MKRGRTAASSAVLVVTMLLLGATAAAEQPPAPPAAEPVPGVWDEVRRLYEAAKRAGENVPDDIQDWMRRDLDAIGDWEYRVLDVERQNRAALERAMNELGAERWECFAVAPHGTGQRLFFRRPARTYLDRIPVGQLLRVIPAPGGGA